MATRNRLSVKKSLKLKDSDPPLALSSPAAPAPDVESPAKKMDADLQKIMDKSTAARAAFDAVPESGDFDYSFTCVVRNRVWRIPDSYFQTDSQHPVECSCFYCTLLYSGPETVVLIPCEGS